MKYIFAFLFLQFFCVKSIAQVTTFDIDSSKFNKPLMAKLDSLYQEDQAPRYKYLDALHANESTMKIDSLKEIMHKKDKQNILVVNSILKQYGWLGPQKVGFKGSQALFEIIQHADLQTQIIYLPMIRTAEKNGEILSSNLAILEDRINVRENLEQVYGSQGFTDKQTGRRYMYPIVDPDHLDERRKSMGLSLMKDYVKDWTLEEYKKELTLIEKLAKEQKL